MIQRLKNLLFFLVLILGILFLQHYIFAQDLSPDAIAIRVIPNPQHYSALRWYQEQGFSGSPQSLLVDGYRAIRDGRTVYVNVANIDDKGTATTSDDDLYTNIYLISYNQNAEQETIDIFGQILAHWKFNTNIIKPGVCEDSGKICLLDSDCEIEDFCTSPKARTIRDVRRLEDLADIKTVLDNYKIKYGKLPILDSGSYLPHKTISVWPSWQGTLGKELGVTLPIDPVNRLGECGDPKFNPITCWDEETQEFADADPSDPGLNLPKCSKVYVYSVSDDGASYNICGTMETDYINVGTGGACSFSVNGGISGGFTLSSNVVAGNHSPVFSSSNLLGESGEEYRGYIEATDPDGDNLTWTIDTSLSSWNMWSSAPQLNNTPSISQKELYATQAGVAGVYQVKVTIDDGRGETNSVVSKIFSINIINQPPEITISNVSYEASSTKPINFIATVQDSISNYPLSRTLTGVIPANLVESFVQSGAVYNFTISGIIDPALNSIPNNISYSYNLNVQDSFGANSTASFVITIVNNPPVINTPLSCPTSVRINDVYGPCQITANDPEHNQISYTYSGLPTGLNANSDGVLSGTPSVAGNYTITITPHDEYGAVGASVTLNLAVNTYCGDGSVQNPNMEGVGGPLNDGNEECDDGNTNDNDACNNNCEWTCHALTNILFSLGDSDAMWYDDDNDPYHSENVAGGTYLKLAVSMPTPYIWIANSNINKVTKMRTFNGCKRTSTGWDCSIWETRGQIIGIYNVGDNPSRTAVNVETGDVWIANRGTDGAIDTVMKLDIDGNIKKTCNVGNGPRGVAIEENGDVWVANSIDGNAVKIPEDDSSCSILATVNLGGYPYGLAIDGNNNVWVSNRGSCLLQKIDTNTLTVTNYNLPFCGSSCGTGYYRPYGLAVDLNNDVWLADTCNGVWHFDHTSGVAAHHSFAGLSDANGRSRGVTIDIDGSIWIAMDFSNQVVKIPDPTNPAVYQIFNTGGNFPVGIVGDSTGQVWAVNRNSSNASVFDSIGNVLGIYNVNSSTMVDPYTYSDMTGLNRAMILRYGSWVSDTSGIFDSGFFNQHWGVVSWQEVIPSSNQNISVYLRADDVDPTTQAWIDANTWNTLTLPQKKGRYLQIKVDMRSNEVNVTPVLWDLSVKCN